MKPAKSPVVKAKTPKKTVAAKPSDVLAVVGELKKEPAVETPVSIALPEPVYVPIKSTTTVPVIQPEAAPASEAAPITKSNFVTQEEFQELAGDVMRLAHLLGDMLGGQFTEHANEIFTKRQGGVNK